MSQNGQKLTSLMMSLTECPKPKKFFHCKLERLPESFEGLDNSLAQSAEELCSW